MRVLADIGCYAGNLLDTLALLKWLPRFESGTCLCDESATPSLR